MANNIARPEAFSVPPADYGDAMLQLTENQRKFVLCYLETGGQEEQRAAYLAGFGNSIEVAAVAACHMMRMPTVLAAIREEADRRLRGGGILGASVIIEIARDARHKDRFKAAQELLNRSGLIVEQTHRVIHEERRSDAEIERAVKLLAEKVGIDPSKLLGAATPLEGEFTEVVDGSEGLEDIL